jgi:xanthine dehydrogenase small subunit
MPSQVIRFLLNGAPRALEHPPATRTVLEYLRLDEHLTGTKEGCAEGDCGACTVVLAEEGEEGQVRCRAVNACIQFLPTLEGKALYTVEALGTPGHPHPVQQAMLEHHGSQCGFCTPGFVMSLFALYKTDPAPTLETIEDALSGNLCRCTGYRPIVDAARDMARIGAALPADKRNWITRPAGAVIAEPSTPQMTSKGAPPLTPIYDEAALLARLRDLHQHEPVAGLHVSGKFHVPKTIGQLLDLRARLPHARLVAGGTDVGLWLTKRLQTLDEVIFLGAVDELATLRTSETHLEIGAGAKLTDVAPHLVRLYPGARDVLRRFASPPIRNAATLGGNIANGSPIGDSMPCLIALGARLVLSSSRGRRELPLEEFFIDYQKTALAPDEIVERVRVPLPLPGEHFRAYKISKRYDQDISIVLMALYIRLEEGRVADCRVACGGMAAIPRRARGCEEALRNNSMNMEAITIAQRALSADFNPINDLRGSASYRLTVARNLLERFFRDIANDLPGESLATAEPIAVNTP